MTTPSLTAALLRGLGLTIGIAASFAGFWALQGSAALPDPARTITTVLVLAITLGWLVLAYSWHRAAHHVPDLPTPIANPFRSRSYWLAALGQFIAIPIAARILTLAGHPEAIMPAVAFIVGLHFFGLIPAFRSWRFAAVGGAMALLALLSLRIPPNVVVESTGQRLALRTAILGFGCAIILWGSIIPFVIETRRQLRQEIS